MLFDVGANIGQTTAEFMQVFRQPRIFAFEPSPAPFNELRTRFGNRSDVRLNNVALSDLKGAALYVTPHHSVNDSLLRPLGENGTQVISGAVETVDGYCERNGIDMIDLLKIDTQGNDLNVLRGTTRMLTARRIRFFFLEVMFQKMYTGQPGLVDIASFADEAGYQVVGVYDHYYFDNRLSHVNICFHSGNGK